MGTDTAGPNSGTEQAAGDSAAAPAQPSASAAATPAGPPSVQPAASAMTDTPPVVPARLMGLDLGPACSQCGGMMQRTGSCYTCSSCGNNTGCG
jgi:ribonucleoside-diphosphate reductase alpha chain